MARNPPRKKRRLSLSLKDKRFATPLAERDMQKVCEGFTPKNETLNYWLSRFVVECRRGDGKAKQVQSVKYLGLIMDPQLSWKEHTIKTISKAKSRIYAINRLKPLSGHLLIRLYRSFVMPIFEYCDVVWTPPENPTRQNG